MVKTELFSLISEAYFQNKMFESLLIEGEKQNQLFQVAHDVSRFLYCQNHQFTNDNCLNCQKFNQHQILDYYEVGDGFLAITKENLQTTLEEFEQTAKGFNQPKILVIANAENLKTQTANALLKFLEEPTKNTFLILLTKNKNEVLPTIKSRTKIFTLDFINHLEEENFLVKVLKSKKESTILLLNNKMKKMEKEELIQLVQDSLPYFLNDKAFKMYELGLVFISDLRFDANKNLSIDHFLIKASQEDAWKF